MAHARLPQHLVAAVEDHPEARRWCVAALDVYAHGTLSHGGPRFSGARFENLAREDADPNRVTPADLLAVTMLDVAVPADAAIRFLGPAADDITRLLIELGPDRDLHEVTAKFVADDSTAGQLWALLRAWREAAPGTGPTTTSKVLARKRPRLLPIWDRVVGEQLGLPDHRHHWQEVHRLLTDLRLVDLLRETRAEASCEEFALLRVLDVLLWMSDPKRYDGPPPSDLQTHR